MSIRWRLDGRLLCAAMCEPEDGDCYIDDRLHYALSVEARAILADADHESNGLWHWAHGPRLRAVVEYSSDHEALIAALPATQQPNPPLGGDEAKAVAWRRRALGHMGWIITDSPKEAEAWRAANFGCQPLYAAPVLPVEVREKIARIVDPEAWSWKPFPRDPNEGRASKQAFDAQDRSDARHMEVRKKDARSKADAILSTIKGDA